MSQFLPFLSYQHKTLEMWKNIQGRAFFDSKHTHKHIHNYYINDISYMEFSISK